MSLPKESDYDVIIVGGGPAGLNAALILGRARRRVLVCDTGVYRNAWSHAMHGFLTRDGFPPSDVIRVGREQLAPYGVEICDIEVTSACTHESGFSVRVKGGAQVVSRKLLLATGVKDHVPDIPGVEELYGVSVHHCPYCDGWEWRDQPVAVLGKKQHGYKLALSLQSWTPHIVLLTSGRSGLTRPQREKLSKLNIPVDTRKIERLEGQEGYLQRIVFGNGKALERRALFFSTGQDQCCDLAEKFGCVFNSKGTVQTRRSGASNVPGLYVCGDASFDVQFVVVAAAEGAKAAVAIHEELQGEDRKARLSAAPDNAQRSAR